MMLQRLSKIPFLENLNGSLLFGAVRAVLFYTGTIPNTQRHREFGRGFDGSTLHGTHHRQENFTKRTA